MTILLRSLMTITSSLFILLTACSNNQSTPTSQAEPTPEQTTSSESVDNNTTDKPTYVVSAEVGFVPFSFRGDDNQIVGFDVDVLNAIAEHQNLQFEYVASTATEQFNGLKSHKYDILASGVSITDARKETMQFSDPYFTSYQAVVWLPSTPKITDFDQLKNQTIAVIPKTTSEKIAKSIVANSSQIIYGSSNYNIIEKVAQNAAKYAMGNSPVLSYYVKDLKDLDLQIYINQELDPEHYGFAFSKDRNDDLVEKINLGLQEIKADGTYSKIEQKWFGNTSK